ncbi:PE-PPE domain-containing protein [Nocardia vinacea]|uniref:PE-PPE domain-containing protein n=1 Tax=Nocardia vinacea TaxID=96468 RepID=UPI0033C576A7
MAGTGEHMPPGSDRPVGMLAEVTKLLDSDRFAVWGVPYPASYGPDGGDLGGLDYKRSVDVGIQALLAEIRSTTNNVVLLGYSQGATVVSRVLEGMARGDYPDIEVAGAGLIANPHRAPGWASIDGSNEGFGIAGAHAPWPDTFPVYEVAQPKDPIPCLQASSPLRGFADLTEAFSVSDPLWWGHELVDKVSHAATQQWIEPSSLDLTLAVEDALNYAVFGQHTCYASLRIPATGRTYCEELAHLINTQIRE